MRSVAAEIVGNISLTITAEAFVVLAAAAYFSLATNVIWPAAASSIPATPVMSQSGPSRRASRVEAISESFTHRIVIGGYRIGDSNDASNCESDPVHVLGATDYLTTTIPYSVNIGTCSVSPGFSDGFRFRPAGPPITARTVNPRRADRGT